MNNAFLGHSLLSERKHLSPPPLSHTQTHNPHLQIHMYQVPMGILNYLLAVYLKLFIVTHLSIEYKISSISDIYITVHSYDVAMK